MSKGIVYIVRNDAFKEDLIKIGFTKDLKQRLVDLSGSNVPKPYECLYACRVDNYREVEKALQNLCHDTHYAKEFFKTDPKRIIHLLKQLGFKDITQEVINAIDEKVSSEKTKVKIVNKKEDVPEGYYTAVNLKKYLSVKPNFRYGYFIIRVCATHKWKNTPYYKIGETGYYNKDVFIDQAKIEGILKE